MRINVIEDGTFTNEHVSTQKTLARGHVSKKAHWHLDTLAREHLMTQGTLAGEHVNTQGT